MLDGDPNRVRLVYSLLFSLPGTPVLFYGEEIGMGENLEVPGRLSVRTPMQWTDERNGGFSPAAPSRLPRPFPSGRFGPLAVNVADQRRDPDSMLNWIERLIRRRRETPEFGWGTLALLERRRRRPSSFTAATGRAAAVVAVHNLSPDPRHVTVDIGATSRMVIARSTCSMTLHPLVALTAPTLECKLDGYGFTWLRLQHEDQRTAP